MIYGLVVKNKSWEGLIEVPNEKTGFNYNRLFFEGFKKASKYIV